MRPLLIGEDNPHSADPLMALFPDPPGCAGHRLCTRVLGLSPSQYLARYRRANLCPSDAWDNAVARHEATAWLHRVQHTPDPVVLLGSKVAEAFRLRFDPFTVVDPGLGAPPLVLLPHPSGRSRLWNDPGAYERARQVLRSVGALW